MKLVDSTFLIDLLNGKKDVLPLLKKKEILLTTQLNVFEVLVGLFYRRASVEKIQKCQEAFNEIRVLPLNDEGIIRSAEISARLQKGGKMIDDVDCLTAGIALSKGVDTIITRNTKHFKRIKELKVESY